VLEGNQIERLLTEFGFRPDPEILKASNSFGEPLLRFLGAQEIVSVDASPYQGASVLHDMNLPIPDDLKGRFDVVLEGGTLEHIFNFPVAMRNCMEMLAPGGFYLGISPANNFCGHGFYQFSPDLFFRIFSQENGFRIERVILCEVSEDAEWFEVLDPLKVSQFVETLGGVKPTYLLIHAKKLEDVPLFRRYPEQSVYTMLWKGEFPGKDSAKLTLPGSKI
jgi:SAM-dependent methyltransferase